MAVDARPDGQRFGGHASGEPEDFIDVVDGHVGQDAAALVAVGRGIRIFERRIDFEDPANDATVHELLWRIAVARRSGAERRASRVWMIAVEFGGERAIGLQLSGQRLLQ